ncbi:hypothetical protein ACHAXR_008234 [Thalassiosira sp. AJA248-18]
MSHHFARNSSPPEWDLLLSAGQKNNADEVLRLLNEVGVPPSHGNIVGQTAVRIIHLSLICYDGPVFVLGLLTRIKFLLVQLHIAALWGSVEAMEVLINAGANVNAQNQIAKTTPLICAIKGTFQSFKETHIRRIQCVKLLLEAGADGKLCDNRGKDAFDSIDDAIRESHMRKMGNIEEEMGEMRKALESAGMNKSPLGRCIEAVDVRGVKDCLAGCGEDGDTEDTGDTGDTEDTGEDDNDAVTQVDLNKGLRASVEKFVDESNTDSGAYNSLRDIIICSAYSRAPREELASATVAAEIIQDLLAHGAKVGSCSMDLLPSASHRGNIQSVEFLTKSVGIDPNFRGRQGMTSAILASRSGKTDIVKLLLALDSLDLSIVDDAGKSAIDYATANGKEEIVGLLEEACQ